MDNDPLKILRENLNRKSDKKFAEEQQKKQFKHDWKIAIFSTLAGSFLSKPLWEHIIPWIINLFSHTQQ